MKFCIIQVYTSGWDRESLEEGGLVAPHKTATVQESQRSQQPTSKSVLLEVVHEKHNEEAKEYTSI